MNLIIVLCWHIYCEKLSFLETLCGCLADNIHSPKYLNSVMCSAHCVDDFQLLKVIQLDT